MTNDLLVGPSPEEQEQYELGEDVTEMAVDRKKPSGIVLSIRLGGDSDLLAELERQARAEDRTLSYVARRALRRGMFFPGQWTPNYVTTGTPTTVIHLDDGIGVSRTGC